MASSRTVMVWLQRAGWAALPFTLGPALAAALHPHSAPVRTTASVAAWAAWVVTLVAALVPNPATLVVLRCAAPAAAAVAIAAAATGRPSDVATVVGVGWGVAVAIGALLPATGILYVNGPAYPNERRFPLAPPGALLLGPVPLAWAAVVGLPATGLLLLAAREWVAGAVVAALGGAAGWLLGRALHRLGRRWIVFVPAGVVLHDPMSLLEPVLFRRQVIESLGPAPAGTDSLDLTQRAPGLALELVLTEKVGMTVAGKGEGSSARLLFTPTRPGAVLAEAASRRIPIAQAAGPPPRTASPS